MTGEKVTIKTVYDQIEKLRKEIHIGFIPKSTFEIVIKQHAQEVERLKADFKDFKKESEVRYAKKNDQDLIKRIVFSTIGLIAVGFLTAVINFFIRVQ